MPSNYKSLQLASLQYEFDLIRHNRFDSEDDKIEYPRTLRKLAPVAFVDYGLAKIKDHRSPVLPAILGEANDIGRWVGTITDPVSRHEGHLHRVLIRRDEQKGLLLGDVQLFSDSQTPRYGVILGELEM